MVDIKTYDFFFRRVQNINKENLKSYASKKIPELRY